MVGARLLRYATLGKRLAPGSMRIKHFVTFLNADAFDGIVQQLFTHIFNAYKEATGNENKSKT